MKSEGRLKDKLQRKESNGIVIMPENIFDEITDLTGIRVLNFYLEQIYIVHEAIMNEVKNSDLILYEKPKAYTWDIDLKFYYERLGRLF